MSLPMLLISACAGPPKIEYLPLYLTQQPDRPAPPSLKEVDVKYMESLKLFTLEPDEFDNLKVNLLEMDKYIELLIARNQYYEDATTAPKEPSAE